MDEFLIKRADGEWFTFPQARFPDVLRPLAISSHPVTGWGSHRIEVEGAEVSFSDEAIGFQVAFETGNLDATRQREIVDDICRNIEAVTGQKSTVVEL